MIPISGLYESHLTVSDLDRSIAFYCNVVGLELAHTLPKRHAAFFWVGPVTFKTKAPARGYGPVRVQSAYHRHRDPGLFAR